VGKVVLFSGGARRCGVGVAGGRWRVVAAQAPRLWTSCGRRQAEMVWNAMGMHQLIENIYL
jgi:hypothetical protein